jgi:creatinine amidohydrolase/Fe(II)-dependent formamide hydrolase-like protein
MMIERARRVALGIAVASCASIAAAAAPATVLIEDLTSTELRDRIAAGTTTVLVPVGGTEQNGPHMVLGKHNVRVRVLAQRIAQRLGHTVVAPVLAYAPEGEFEPPTQHMRWAGTISITPAAFEAVLEGAARSFKRHGFRHIVLLGDHGGYQSNLERVAAKLNREWAAQPVRVHALTEYYRVTQGAYVAALKAKGLRVDEIGTHAGLADTSLALAVDPALVHMDIAAARTPDAQDGVAGDPRRSGAELGRLGTEQIVEASVVAIKARIHGAGQKERP